MWTLYCETSHNNIEKYYLNTWPNALSHRIVSFWANDGVFREKNSLWISNRIIFSKWNTSNLLLFALSIQSRIKMRRKWGHAIKNTSTAIRSLWPSACLATVNFSFVWSVFFYNSVHRYLHNFLRNFPRNFQHFY